MSIVTGAGRSCRLLERGEILERFQELQTILGPAFAVAEGELDEIDALVLATEGKAFVFVGESNSKINVTMICEFIQYPKKKVCNVLAYAGRARDHYTALVWVENWAKANGAQEIRGYGKAPHARLAQRHGLRTMYLVYGKPL